MFNFETSGRTKIAGGIVGAFGLFGACYYYWKLKKGKVSSVVDANKNSVENKKEDADTNTTN